MASENSDLLYCYNKGCGVKFDPKDNKEDSCCFHPGEPVFHDAYKGWSCCNKRSIDFTEFLNLKGCTNSFHSNVKPPEPEKPQKTKCDEVYEYKAPSPKVSTIVRPSFNSPLTKLEPSVSEVLKNQIQSLVAQKSEVSELGEIQTGTSCKNSGCKEVYQGSSTIKSECIYHSGVPVFHEGMKFWSCCNKKTTDFAAFLEQVGCTTGEHVWLKKDNSNDQPNCRYDWHQTGTHVFISVYAKMCDPNKSIIEINPIRVKIHLEFPENNTFFDKDLELCGVVDVEKCGVSMLPTKVEVKLKKAEPGSWSKLNLTKVENVKKETEESKKSVSESKITESVEDDVVDLNDIN